MRPKNHHGIGATCSVLLKYLHPAKRVSEIYPNSTSQQRLTGAVECSKEMITVNRKKVMCIVMVHPSYPDDRFHSAMRWVRVDVEGESRYFFDDSNREEVSQQTGGVEQVSNAVEIDNIVLQAGNNSEDIANVRAMGLGVDDDNEPAPENVPTTESRDEVAMRIASQSWGWNGIDNRAITVATDVKPSMKNVKGDALKNISCLSMWILFFPFAFLQNVIIKETNKKLRQNKLQETDTGEFLTFLGIWLFMSCFSGFNREEYFSAKLVSIDSGAPYRFNEYMAGARFKQLNRYLCFTDCDPPSYQDKFWEVRQMIAEWNKNMREQFSPSWISCLDESMSIWYSRWTCPGWMFVPRKPHPFGNEYHSISCGISTIMYGIELVEGKDEPPEKATPKFTEKGKTASLLLRLCECIFSSGRVVVLDSGFCVLQALIELRKMGVFAAAVVKKRRYWPKYIPGDIIADYMQDKDIGYTDSLKGVIDEVPYDIFCMKTPEYVMKLMSTYGGLKEPSRARKDAVWSNNGTPCTFRYTECFANHFDFRHVVDDHNHLRHAAPAIEETWLTHRWPMRVFTFLFALSEINAFLAFRFFVWADDEKLTLLEFRRRFALEMIRNNYIGRGSDDNDRKRRKRMANTCHEYIMAPPHASKFVGRKWVCKAKARYQQYVCAGKNCKKQVRSYCQCDPGRFLCKGCYGEHLLCLVREENV